MKAIVSILLLAVCLSLAQAFAPSGSRSYSTSLAFFGSGGKKKEVKKEEGSGFLTGKGKKITIRDDEDAAMWIEEEKPKKKGKGK
jgi:hypothetical protein